MKIVVRGFASLKNVVVKDDIKNRWKATLGIIGSPLDAALLSKVFVEECNKIGLKDDQQIPEFISIGFPINHSRRLRDLADLAIDFGCDAILSSSSLTKKFADNIKCIKSNTDDLNLTRRSAKRALDYILEIDKPRRSHALLGDSLSSDALSQNLKYDEARRNDRMDYELFKDFYPTIAGREFAAVLHGAGPGAGCAAMEHLSRECIPFFGWAVNSAPGKNNFELGIGESYIPYYQNAVRFFNKIGSSKIIIPCNTAHARLSEFCDDESLSKVIDIRRATLSVNRSSDGFILFGTNRTTGVGLTSGKQGLYEEIRLKEFPHQGPFILPNEDQQKQIMKAIYDVKAGQYKVAKKAIIEVIEEIRKNPEYKNFRIILGCTELPMPFTRIELEKLRLIDPMENVAIQCKQDLKQINDTKINNEARENNQNTGFVEKLKSSQEDRSKNYSRNL